MAGVLPIDRLAVKSRVTFQIALGVLLLASGIAVIGGFDSEGRGWIAALPSAVQTVAEAAVVLVGLAFLVPGLWWVLVTARGPRPTVVHFEADRVEIRGSLVPRTFVVGRTSIREVHLVDLWLPPAFGLGPMVVVKTSDGRGKGIQNLYDGDPNRLLEDLAAWSEARVGPRRRLRRDGSIVERESPNRPRA